MKRILFIDPNSQTGHVNLNRVYVGKLTEIGLQVDLAVKEGYVAELGHAPESVRVEFPALLCDDRYAGAFSKLTARYRQLRILLYLRRHVDLVKYDYLFFSSFEEISLYLSGIRGRLFLLNHANVSDLANPVKRFFLRRLAARSTFIVFHEFIERRCQEFGITSTAVVPLGLSEPYLLSQSKQLETLRRMDPRLASGRPIVWIPTGSKYSDGSLGRMMADPAFLRFIAEKDLLVVVKDRELTVASEHVVIFRDAIGTEEYQALFSASRCVVINYPASFEYRVSAVMLECFSNDKPCLLSDIEGFRAFAHHFRYEPFFSNARELAARLTELLAAPSNLLATPYRDLEAFHPSFARLFPRQEDGNEGGG